MSQSASQSEPAERFAHILQPIKDLTRNWDIDIAACLEDYLEEVIITKTPLSNTQYYFLL